MSHARGMLLGRGYVLHKVATVSRTVLTGSAALGRAGAFARRRQQPRRVRVLVCSSSVRLWVQYIHRRLGLIRRFDRSGLQHHSLLMTPAPALTWERLWVRRHGRGWVGRHGRGRAGTQVPVAAAVYTPSQLRGALCNLVRGLQRLHCEVGVVHGHVCRRFVWGHKPLRPEQVVLAGLHRCSAWRGCPLKLPPPPAVAYEPRGQWESGDVDFAAVGALLGTAPHPMHDLESVCYLALSTFWSPLPWAWVRGVGGGAGAAAAAAAAAVNRRRMFVVNTLKHGGRAWGWVAELLQFLWSSPRGARVVPDYDAVCRMIHGRGAVRR